VSGKARDNGEGSIYPYRNGFAAYAWVTTLNGCRKRKYVYGKTRDEVHDKWIQLLAEARKGPVATSTPTVEQHLKYWLKEVIEPNRAPLTYSTYETLTRLYLIPGLGAKRLDRLQVRDVQTWLNKVRQTCQCCAQGKDARRREETQKCCAVGRCCGQTPSLRTVSDLRTVLRSALSDATIEELISKNVASLVRMPATRRRKGQAWSSEEAQSFLESARIAGDPMYAAYVLILVLGLRKGETLGLTWEDINLEAAELSIRRQIQRVRRQLLHRETKTKSSDAMLPLPDICLAALGLRRRQWQQAKEDAGPAWQSSDLVFCTRYGSPIEPRNFNRAFTNRCVKAGVRRITVHDARRTCASLLVDLDVHPRVVMQILRHAQFSVTMEIYTQVSSKATREALRRLGERLETTDT
jgi:integrase